MRTGTSKKFADLRQRNEPEVADLRPLKKSLPAHVCKFGTGISNNCKITKTQTDIKLFGPKDYERQSLDFLLIIHYLICFLCLDQSKVSPI
jgi:hypothetical protein